MDSRANLVPLAGDGADPNAPLTTTLRSGAQTEVEPSAPGASSPQTNTINEIRELNKCTAALESMINSLISSIKGKTICSDMSAPSKLPPQNHGKVPVRPASVSVRETSPVHSDLQTTSTISKSAVRDALEIVPKFDGHNISVLQFAKACKRARKLIPPSEEGALARYLRGRLVGHAYLAVEDDVHDTVDQLLDSLKQIFSLARTPNFYRGQLSVVHKGPNEHILDYISRVKDLRNAIIEGDQTAYGRELTSDEIAHVDANTVESFFEGLPPTYRAEMQKNQCKFPAEVYNEAIIVAKRLKRDRMYLGDTRTGPPPVTVLWRDPYHSPTPVLQAPRDSFPTRICGYCKKTGHLISECRKRQNNGRVFDRTVQGNALMAPASENRGRLSHHVALTLQENPLPSIPSDPRPRTSQPLN